LRSELSAADISSPALWRFCRISAALRVNLQLRAWRLWCGRLTICGCRRTSTTHYPPSDSAPISGPVLGWRLSA
jgi:hypothetical protein